MIFNGDVFWVIFEQQYFGPRFYLYCLFFNHYENCRELESQRLTAVNKAITQTVIMDMLWILV